MANDGFFLGGFAEGQRAANEMSTRSRSLDLDKRKIDLLEKQSQADIQLNQQKALQDQIAKTAAAGDAILKEAADRIGELAKSGDLAGAEKLKGQYAQLANTGVDSWLKRFEKYGGSIPVDYAKRVLSIPIIDPLMTAKTTGAGKVAELGPMAEATGQPLTSIAAAQGQAAKPLEQIGAEAEAARPSLGRVAAEADIEAQATAHYRAPPEVMQIADALGYPEGSEERRQFLLGATQTNQPGAARDAEIADLMASFKVDRPTAIKIKDGLIKVSQPDEQGNISLIDTVTQQSVGTINPQQDRLQRQQAGAEPTSSGVSKKAYEDVAEQAVGGPSQLGRIASGVAGALGGKGEVAPESQEAQRSLGRINSQLRALLIPEGKPSNWEQQQVDKLLPDPTSAFTSPTSARKAAEEMREFLKLMREQYENAARNPDVTPDQRAKSADTAQRYNQALALLGNPSGSTARSAPDAPYVQTQEEYDSIPSGSNFRQMDENGKWGLYTK